MAMYWRIQSLPELNHLTDEQRRRVMQHIWIYSPERRLAANGCMVAFLALGVTSAATFAWLNGTGQLIVGIGVLILGFCLGFQWSIRTVRRHLRLALVEGFRGERLPVCIKCGYDLKGIEGRVCPECGSGIMVKKKPGASK